MREKVERLKRNAVTGQKTVSFRQFKERLYPNYLHAAHLELIDAALMDAMKFVETQGAEGHGFHIFEMPPRHGKTVSISRLFPPYGIGTHPDWRFIMASYGATLAYKNSRAARNFMLSPRYAEMFPDVMLASDSKSTDAWNVAHHEGGLDAMGVGGGATGKGGQFIIVDDPVKSRAEAESEVYREKIWDWFTDDIYSRREPGGAIIVVMTRWHQDDLVGRLLLQDPEKWRRLRLPALAEDNDPLGRKVGEALWPARFPEPVLRDTEKMMGAYSWSALYQQNPVPAEGGLFKRVKFNIVDREPADIEFIVRYWDLALSERTSADHTVGVKFGITKERRIVILDVERFQVDWDDVPDRIERVALKDGNRIPIGIETAFFHTQAVKKLLQRQRLHLFSIKGYPVDTDKFTRALPFAARVGEGMVDVLRRNWTEAYLDELCGFPLGAHDDQVDASSGAYLMLDKRPIMAVIKKYA